MIPSRRAFPVDYNVHFILACMKKFQQAERKLTILITNMIVAQNGCVCGWKMRENREYFESQAEKIAL